MKLTLTAEQKAILAPTIAALGHDEVCLGQVRLILHPDQLAGEYALFYTLISQDTARKLRKLRKIIEKAL